MIMALINSEAFFWRTMNETTFFLAEGNKQLYKCDKRKITWTPAKPSYFKYIVLTNILQYYFQKIWHKAKYIEFIVVQKIIKIQNSINVELF